MPKYKIADIGHEVKWLDWRDGSFVINPIYLKEFLQGHPDAVPVQDDAPERSEVHA